jgi:phosphatidylinositol phospholipase C delta
LVNYSVFLATSVALNFQMAGVEMDLNDGLFSQNGRCGYVLKPDFMRMSERRFDPEVPQNREGYQPRSLLLSGTNNKLRPT